MVTITKIDIPSLQGVVDVQSAPLLQDGALVTLQKAFEDAIAESGGRIEVRSGFVSGKPKLVGKRLGVYAILYTLADTLSFPKTQEELDIDLKEIQASLDFAAALCEQEVQPL